MTSVYDFTLRSLQGHDIPLRQFEGQPLIIVNTASKCGFTPQFEGLQALWSRHREKGLQIVGVPSNDFGRQEPGDSAEIAAFCRRNYGVGFPMAEKRPVRGRDADPLFGWLAEQGGALSRPRWNFYKYLIGRDGQLAGWFSSLTSPESNRFQNAVLRLVWG